MVVVRVADDDGVDLREFVEANARVGLARRADERDGADALRPDRIGQDRDAIHLHEHRGDASSPMALARARQPRGADGQGRGLSAEACPRASIDPAGSGRVDVCFVARMDDCLALDRLSPTRRPPGPSAGTQRWRELLFVHWSFPADVVRELVPRSFELDLWQGRAWVGLVPFRMEATRPAWLPRQAGLEFLETNVRTYVHRHGEPGVFFFSLEASSWLAVHAARLTWSLPYFHAAMTASRSGDRVTYGSRRRAGAVARLDVTYEIGASLGPSTAGSLEHFLLERYYLFVERGGRPLKGQVHHAPYPTRSARISSIDDGLLGAAGLPGGRLETVHYSDGVEVEVFGPFAC